jgi:dCMP deaminase
MTTIDYLRLAYLEAHKSPDLSTQNGAVLVTPGGLVIGGGHNGPPPGIAATRERLETRPLKYQVINHAEDAALFDAVRRGHDGELIAGSTLYCPWYACAKCACVAIALGVKRIVGHRWCDTHGRANGKWVESVALGFELLAEAGVTCDWYDGPIGGVPPLRFNGSLHTP